MAGGCAGTDGTRSAEPEQTATNVAALLTGDFDGDGTSDQLTVTSTGISIYHPTQRSTHSYYYTGNFAINNANTDLDGKAGLEVVLTTANGISVISATGRVKQIVPPSGGPISDLSWAPGGVRLAFLRAVSETDSTSSLFVYNVPRKLIYQVGAGVTPAIHGEMRTDLAFATP